MWTKWLTSEGQEQEPSFWSDSRFNRPNQPVVGVNWYEAMAYAAWLARVTGKPYRLPTEAEWEWAARRSRRRYPWGNEWDAERCNWQGSRLNRPNPVGVYPHRRNRGRPARVGGQRLRVDIEPLSGLSLRGR